MKSEIAWLMEAFLEEDAKKIRVMIKDRMAEVTKTLTTPQVVVHRGSTLPDANFFEPDTERVVAAQSPSMRRIMADNPDLIPKPPTPVTPAAAQALAARQALISGAVSGKQEEGRRSPRKA